MAKSILQVDNHSCFLCGGHSWIEEHHVFGGANRRKSEKYGLKVFLCHWCHNEPPHGVHHYAEANKKVKAYAQRAAMDHYGWTEDQFRTIFGKSYL